MLRALDKTKNFANRFGQAVPLGFFFSQTFLPDSSETVDSRTPIVVGGTPFSGDPTRLLHAMKRRVKRSLLYAQCVISDLLNARGDAVPVSWLMTERLENQKIEGPLERVRLLRFFHYT
jgi:hypothetical protein